MWLVVVTGRLLLGGNFDATLLNNGALSAGADLAVHVVAPGVDFTGLGQSDDRARIGAIFHPFTFIGVLGDAQMHDLDDLVVAAVVWGGADRGTGTDYRC